MLCVQGTRVRLDPLRQVSFGKENHSLFPSQQAAALQALTGQSGPHRARQGVSRYFML